METQFKKKSLSSTESRSDERQMSNVENESRLFYYRIVYSFEHESFLLLALSWFILRNYLFCYPKSNFKRQFPHQLSTYVFRPFLFLRLYYSPISSPSLVILFNNSTKRKKIQIVNSQQQNFQISTVPQVSHKEEKQCISGGGLSGQVI